jgi:hypothetical protein
MDLPLNQTGAKAGHKNTLDLTNQRLGMPRGIDE